MSVATAFFYLFSFVTIASSAMVIIGRNPVHSVLFLILAFVSSAGLFLLAGAEFLAMLLVVVYVGAVMVLFLFVVMMLDVDFAELQKSAKRYLPLGGLVALVVLAELALVVGSWNVAPQAVLSTPTPGNLSNTAALGQVLYTQYVYLFQAAGFVLLTAMIGAIVLTLHHRPNVKRQDISAQNARTRASAIENKQVPSRTGVPVP